MNENNIAKLKQIHDTLAMTHPTGQDILIMADCIRAIEQIITEAEKEDKEE